MNVLHLFAAIDSSGYDVLSVLFSLLWQSSILLAAAGALAWMLRKRGDAVRHAVWTAAVLALPLLPLLSLGAAWLGSPRTEIAVMPVYEALSGTSAQTIRPDQPVPAPVPTPAPTPGKIVELVPDHAEPPFSPLDYPWALGLSGYILIVSGLLVWMLAGRLRIRRWFKEGEAVIDSRVLDAFLKAGVRLGLFCEISFIEHPGVPAPLTCGIVRPVIMLQSGFAERLSETELRVVAFHELAHVRRRDTTVFTFVSLLRRCSSSSRSCGTRRDGFPTWPRLPAIQPLWSRNAIRRPTPNSSPALPSDCPTGRFPPKWRRAFSFPTARFSVGSGRYFPIVAKTYGNSPGGR